MHAILMGHHGELADVEYFQTNSLSLHSEDPVPYELDGEMAGYLPMSLTLDPATLPVFAPPAN